jgi:hypothetical protein
VFGTTPHVSLVAEVAAYQAVAIANGIPAKAGTSLQGYFDVSDKYGTGARDKLYNDRSHEGAGGFKEGGATSGRSNIRYRNSSPMGFDTHQSG